MDCKHSFKNFFRINTVKRNEWTFRLGFQKPSDLHIYLHLRGDEIWLPFLTFPFSPVYFQLTSNINDGIKWNFLSISEREIVSMDKPGLPCKSYVEQARLKNWSTLFRS